MHTQNPRKQLGKILEYRTLKLYVSNKNKRNCESLKTL